VLLLFEEVPEVDGGGGEGGGVEEGERHCERVWFQRKLCWLSCEC
jgi:hypothetical protein